MDATQPVKVGIASRFVSLLQVASKLRQAPRENASLPDFSRIDKPDVIESTALQFFREQQFQINAVANVQAKNL